MAAPKGNQFWKLRSKHGRDKLFASPDLLWDAACEYFQWCDDNPWEMAVMTKVGIDNIPKRRPYSIVGLCVYLDASTSFWKEFKKSQS